MVLRCVVNGVNVEREISTRLLLSDFLRHDLGLRGTHVGCEHGVCGCCTVLLDGKPVRSCLMLAVQAREATIKTVESLTDGPDLHPLQAAFRKHHALQCGFCTPGFLMAAVGAVDDMKTANPTEHDIRVALAGNLCRCTGYEGIVAAVAEVLRADVPGCAND